MMEPMLTHCLLFVFLIIILLVDNPFSFLLVIMSSMMFFTLNWFSMSKDYWSAFLMIMIFLVGLLLLYVYLLSLSTKMELSKSFFSFNTMIMFFFIIISMNSNSYINKDISKEGTYPLSTYDWIFEMKMELILFSILYFTMLIIILYFFVKGMKKSMKSSK